jgi:hypothetical protein
MFPMVHFLHLMVYTASLPLRDSFTTACLILNSGLSGYHNPTQSSAKMRGRTTIEPFWDCRLRHNSAGA